MSFKNRCLRNSTKITMNYQPRMLSLINASLGEKSLRVIEYNEVRWNFKMDETHGPLIFQLTARRERNLCGRKKKKLLLICKVNSANFLLLHQCEIKNPGMENNIAKYQKSNFNYANRERRILKSFAIGAWFGNPKLLFGSVKFHRVITKKSILFKKKKKIKVFSLSSSIDPEAITASLLFLLLFLYTPLHNKKLAIQCPAHIFLLWIISRLHV